MHRLRLRPVPVPGLHEEISAETRQVGIDPLLRREGTSRNGWQPTADALLTMERLRQRVATGRNGFRVFLRFPGPGVLPVIATDRNHGAP